MEFTSLFTFIYSPREGTKAAAMEDPVTKDENQDGLRNFVTYRSQLRQKEPLR